MPDWENRSFNHNGWLTTSAVIFCQTLVNVQGMLDSYVGNFFFPRNFKFLFYLEEPFNNTKIGVIKLDGGLSRINWFSYFISKNKSKYK